MKSVDHKQDVDDGMLHSGCVHPLCLCRNQARVWVAMDMQNRSAQNSSSDPDPIVRLIVLDLARKRGEYACK